MVTTSSSQGQIKLKAGDPAAQVFGYDVKSGEARNNSRTSRRVAAHFSHFYRESQRNISIWGCIWGVAKPKLHLGRFNRAYSLPPFPGHSRALGLPTEQLRQHQYQGTLPWRSASAEAIGP